jgi:ectoine hydroxylase-related dioxygenase (phytanoyl-CoA dioxygenase family)
MDSIISNSLNNIDSDLIAKALSEDGYFIIEDAITEEAVNEILSEGQTVRLNGNINVNDIQLVDYNGQSFISHTLASMRTVAKIITHTKFHEISKKFIGNNFRLKAQRYYESGYGYHLGWHVDNKTVDNVRTNVKGLVFIIYLVDTYDGQLEVIKGSNKWSNDLVNTSFSENELKEHVNSNNFLSLPARKGSLVITDIYTIHQERKITTNFRRKSLFFQIDDDMFHSEKIVINPEFFPRITPSLQKFLGFGLPSGYKTMPVSGVKTLSIKFITNNFKLLFFASIYKVIKKIGIFLKFK